MMHQQIEDEEIIEKYARNQLTPGEREAFEEHYFACQECFEKLQVMERFVAGVRDASSRRLLDSASQEATVGRSRGSWLLPALGLSTCVALLFVIMDLRFSFFQVPKLRQQLNEAKQQLQAQAAARAALEKQVTRGAQAEINLPLVMLQATRNVQAAPSEAVIPPGAQHLALWIELPPGSSGSFRLEIDNADGRHVETMENLTPNSYGALAASLSTQALQSDLYRIRLSRQTPTPATLLAEYQLRIHRP